MGTLLAITFRDLLNPEFYINNGGLWVMLFIVFAETGLMVGFFLPGDSLLFVAGIYSQKLIDKLIPGGTGSDFVESDHPLDFGFPLRYPRKYDRVTGLAKKVVPTCFSERTISFLRKSTCMTQKLSMKNMVVRQLYLHVSCPLSALLLPSLPALCRWKRKNSSIIM